MNAGFVKSLTLVTSECLDVKHLSTFLHQKEKVGQEIHVMHFCGIFRQQ